MNKRALLIAALVAISTVGVGKANAIDVTSWSEINTNRTEAELNILNDITTEGSATPIILKATTAQVINGNGHSITGANGYSFELQGIDVTFNNLGAYSEGTAESNTFSYKDLNNATKYVNINKSVNSFPTYLITRYTNGTSLNVNNSVFANNGGRIIVLSASNNTLNIENSVFYNNSTNVGTAIIDGGNSTNIINIENSVFYNNENKKSEGGAVEISGTATIKNSYFINNKASNDWNGFGGALQFSSYSKGSTIENSKFIGNYAYEEGGAISIEGNATVKYIKNSEFISNSNTEYGGGAITVQGGFIETIENVVFDDNKANWYGGGIWYGISSDYSAEPPILVKCTTFKNNEAGFGGGLYIENASGVIKDAYITDSEFTDNTVKKTGHYTGSAYGGRPSGAPFGGGLFVGAMTRSGGSLGVPVTLNNVTFSGNEAVQDGNNNYSAGGGMYFIGGSEDYPLNIVDSTFSNNSALEGGALFVDNADTSIIAQTKDVIFSGNTAGADADDYNGGADIYFQANEYSATLSLNAAEGKKVVFNGSIASYTEDDKTSTININNSGVTYNTYDGETETPNNAGTAGEIQFNARVGDETQAFSAINLYGGKLSIGQNADNNANTDNPDGYINDNNFSVLGNSTLNTVNGIIGEFAPKAFVIANGVNFDYQMDVDLVNAVSDTINVQSGSIENNGTLKLSSFNIISDADTDGLKIKYSDTNVNGAVKDGYSITTSEATYDITAENDSSGSYIVFSSTEAGGGLPVAIANESDQYIITNGEDEKVDAWKGDDGNIITSDIDINGSGQSIYTENGLDGMVVSQGTNVILRNVEELSGFNNALTNDGGTLTVTDTNITGNSGDADITNNGGTLTIKAESKDVTIGSNDTEKAIISTGGTVNVKGTDKVTFNGDVSAARNAQVNVSADTAFNGDVSVSDSQINISADTKFNGDVQGSNNAHINISADTKFNGDVSDVNIVQSSGTVDVGNLSGASYSMDNGTLNISKNGSFAPENFKLNSGKVNIANESAFSPQNNILSSGDINAINKNTGNLNFNNLTLKNSVNLAVDVDLKNQIMDTISASSVNGNGKINVNKFNILSQTNKSKISIPFAKGPIKTKVSTDIKTIDGKIFRYNVGYDPKTGYFNMSGGGSNAKGYNPVVLASPVATLIGGQITQSQTLQDSFFHMDRYMKNASDARIASEDRNKYALSELHPYPTYVRSSLPETSQAMWVKPYTTFEKVNLKGGLEVSNVSYGALYGGDTDLVDLGRGYKGVISAFVGYNGSHQSYNGISMNQQGGTLGVTGTLYHGNFFTGLTISAGASAGEAHTPFGTDHFTMLTAGIANKTGYNIELADGKFIIQPSLYLGYTFVNNFDYKNSAGINIDSDPLSTIQIAPGIKFIGNLKNGWQPYAGVDMMWNIMGRTKFKAADSRLPELSVKPYIQYGVGLQKSWSDRFTAFFQTMLRNGGRTGIVLEGGFRWTIGKDSSSKTKVENKNINKITDNPTGLNKVVKKGFWSNLIQTMDGSPDVEKTTYNSKKVIKKM